MCRDGEFKRIVNPGGIRRRSIHIYACTYIHARNLYICKTNEGNTARPDIYIYRLVFFRKRHTRLRDILLYIKEKKKRKITTRNSVYAGLV